SACLRSCVDALHSGGAACVATLRTCLADCQGSTSGSCLDLKTLACTPDSCTLGAGDCPSGSGCIPPCPPPPPPFRCFDLLARQCTGTSCSFFQPCPARGQICVPGCGGGSPSGAFVE